MVHEVLTLSATHNTTRNRASCDHLPDCCLVPGPDEEPDEDGPELDEEDEEDDEDDDEEADGDCPGLVEALDFGSCVRTRAAAPVAEELNDRQRTHVLLADMVVAGVLAEMLVRCW